MAKKLKLYAELPLIPEIVTDETVTVPKGECSYRFDFDDAEVELMATGVLPARVAQVAWEALSWKREHARNVARELAELAS